jgi:hypothetical protein
MTIVLHPRIDLLDGGRQSLLFEAGERSVVKKRQRVLPWWVQTPDGKYVLFIRSRWKAVEFEKRQSGDCSLIVGKIAFDHGHRDCRSSKWQLAQASSQMKASKSKGKRAT